MKRASLLLVLFLTCIFSYGQRNPVEGYIITNQNDTLRGTIDYLTEWENCVSCHFKADGQDVFKEYTPADIKGYRFMSDGVYYVVHTVEIEGVSKPVFVEFLIHGGVSLMQYTTSENDDYFIFVGEDGHEVIIKDDNYQSNSLDAPALLKQRLVQRRSLFQIFEKDVETLDKLYKTPYKANHLATVVRNYDETFCDETTDCIQFVYDQKKSRRMETRFIIEAGMMLGDYVEIPRVDHSVLGPRLSLGIQLHSNRKAPAVYYNIMLGISRWEMSGWSREYVDGNFLRVFHESEYWISKMWMPELTLGLEYHILSKKRHTPYFLAGLYCPNFVPLGIYSGIGYEVKAGRQKLRLSATYGATLFYKLNERRYNQFDVSLGVVF